MQLAMGASMPGALTSSLLPIALEAIAMASETIRTTHPAVLQAKGERDMVSDVDLGVERQVRAFLMDRTPGIGVLGEEEGATEGDGRELVWTLDPIDGTVNYVRGLPLTAVSLALMDHDQPVLGVIDLPFLQARYWATHGDGSFLDGTRLHAATTKQLAEAIVALGDFAVGPGSEQENRRRFEVINRVGSVALRARMLGSAAIDLAWLAEGKIDASITLCNRPWDMAAGVVIAREAGARVVDQDGSEYRMGSHVVLGTTPALSDQILSLVGLADRRVPAAQDR